MTTDNREAVAEAAEQSGLSNDEVNQIVDQVTARFQPLTQANTGDVISNLEGAEFLTETGTVRAQRLPSVGTQFTESAGYKELVGRGLSGRFSSGPIEVAATLTEDTSSGGDLLVPQYQPGILPILFRRLTVADLMPNSSTNAASVTYFEEATATNAADTVSEGSAKPESTLAFNQVNEPVRKIATILPVTDEMLEDVQQIRGYIDNRLRLFVQLAEEAQLLSGSGDAPDISGILDRSGVQTQAVGSETYFKDAIAIFKAMTKVRANISNGAGLEPDGLVIHPNDWQDVRLESDANGQFSGGGPFTGQYGNGQVAESPYWGLRVVVTPAITEGTALVGAFASAAQVFRRSGLTVEATNSHDDWFAYNKTAIRAEERLALAVYRPAAFCTVTGVA